MSTSLLPVRRIFSRDKGIESKLLNRLGVQVLRTLLSRLNYRLRSIAISRKLTDRNGLAELEREGIVLLPNFLSPELFERVRDECLSLLDRKMDNVKVLRQGPTKVEMVYVQDFDEHLVSHVSQFYADQRLHSLLEAAERRPLVGSFGVRLVERLTQGEGRDEIDPQTELHSDIFYTVHKVWLYLTSVSVEDGPLVYLKGSHRLSPIQLSYLYRESCQQNAGSRRVTKEEVDRLGLRETIVTCPGNTLVIANTFGYHRRIQGQTGRQRLALNLSLRAKPFGWGL